MSWRLTTRWCFKLSSGAATRLTHGGPRFRVTSDIRLRLEASPEPVDPRGPEPVDRLARIRVLAATVPMPEGGSRASQCGHDRPPEPLEALRLRRMCPALLSDSPLPPPPRPAPQPLHDGPADASAIAMED